MKERAEILRSNRVKLSKPITIIIPNFNGAQLLRKNLPSVIRFANQFSSETRIIVVDDGSKDESVNVLSNEFPDLEIVVHRQNLGFSEAISSGVKAAATDLLFLLNSDVELVEDVFTPLMAYFQDPATFSVCPLIKNEDGEVSRHSWNLRRIMRGRLKLRRWNLEDALEWRRHSKLPALYASGGSMMVRKSMMMELGCFHPIFKPFYGEDFDLGLRAWSRGWPSYFEPTVCVIHQEKGSIEESFRNKRIKSIQRRNRYLLEWIHFSRPMLVFCTLPISLFQLIGEILMIDRVNLKGFAMAVGQLSAARKARVALLRSRSLTLNQSSEKI